MQPKTVQMPIYMDNNATTPIDPRVAASMVPFFHEQFGNPASSHAYGWQTEVAVKKARTQVATLLGCSSKNVVWTSGATESNNLAIFGVLRGYESRPHLITQATEHKAVLEVCAAAELWGCDVTVLGVDSEGRVRTSELEAALRPDTALVSIMAANNEVGTVQPLAEIARICQRQGVILHTDAAQAVGKMPLDLRELPIDLLSFTGHKLYGPKGSGALIVRPINRQFELKPLLFGGEQERGLRPGTLNVAGIVGLGEACALAQQDMAEDSKRLAEFQKQILVAVLDRYPQVRLNGPRADRLANNLNFSFKDLSADTLISELKGIAFSSTSACSAGKAEPSHVLQALGVSPEAARASVRLGLGRFTTQEEIQSLIDKLLKMLGKAYS